MPTASRVAAPTVVLLRGVNVGGANRLPMAALRAALADVGFDDAQTYLQSGNVVVTGRDRAPAGGVAGAVRSCIAERFALDIAVVVRSAADMDGVVAANPFVALEGVLPTQLHVGFLDRIPAPQAAASVDPDRAPPDRLELHGQELYAYCPNGLGRSKVFNGVERLLGAIVTVRNWNTVSRLRDMCHA